MDKVVGFFLSQDSKRRVPGWVESSPVLKVLQIIVAGWNLVLWGHGNLRRFVEGDRVVVGCSDVELPLGSLQNRGLVIDICDYEVHIYNDALGMVPVVYGAKAGVPSVSTCEGLVIEALGKVTLDEGRLVNFLVYQTTLLTFTLWKEIDRLYGNRMLRITKDGLFEQFDQSPLVFHPVHDGRAVEYIHTITSNLIHTYTDPLDEIILPLSAGQDSRLILAYLNRSDRVHVRSYPTSWPADQNIEVKVAKASAARRGIGDFGILDFRGDFSGSTQPFIEYMGTLASAIQVYLYAASRMMGEEHPGVPVLSGVTGDVIAGTATNHVRRWLGSSPNSATAFKQSCYCHANEWGARDLDACLAFDWRGALEPLKKSWARCWEETEGLTPLHRAALVRLRNRCPITITHAWAAGEIWNPMVVPFLDRDYVEGMLSLGESALSGRSAQQRVLSHHHSDIWQYAGIPYRELDDRNTTNQNTITQNHRAFWPLVQEGSKPAHSFFKSSGIKALYNKAFGGHKPSWGLLASLQPIAWAIDQGYVK